MKTWPQHTVQEFLDCLARRDPVPGGGSVAALTGALGAGLLSMAAQYSLNRKGGTPAQNRRLKAVLGKSERLRGRLTACIDRDAQAYLGVVAARKASPARYRTALRQAGRVPFEVAKLCYAALDLAPDLVRDGNPHLLSDVEVAVELLHAAFKSALINVAVNQP